MKKNKGRLMQPKKKGRNFRERMIWALCAGAILCKADKLAAIYSDVEALFFRT